MRDHGRSLIVHRNRLSAYMCVAAYVSRFVSARDGVVVGEGLTADRITFQRHSHGTSTDIGRRTTSRYKAGVIRGGCRYIGRALHRHQTRAGDGWRGAVTDIDDLRASRAVPKDIRSLIGACD